MKSFLRQLESLLVLGLMTTWFGCAQFNRSQIPLLTAPGAGSTETRASDGGVAETDHTHSRNAQAGPRNPYGPAARFSNASTPSAVTNSSPMAAGPLGVTSPPAQPLPPPESFQRAAPNIPPAAVLPATPNAPPELAPVVNPLEAPGFNPETGARAVIRGQSPAAGQGTFNSPTPGTGEHWRYPMHASGSPVLRGQDGVYQPFAAPQVQQYPGQTSQYPGQVQPYPGQVQPYPSTTTSINGPNDYTPILPTDPTNPAVGLQPFNQPAVDVDIMVEEARTGRFMFGAGVNSDLGVTGQIVIDERNFDPWRLPTSWDDVVNGTAWRGAGQGFRLEAMPGSQVQRYLVTHTVPYVYLPGVPEPFVLSTSGFYYTRRYFDWNEQRLGGRVALGYRVTQDLSLTGSIRAEEVTIFDPRVIGLVPQLDRVIGDNELFSGRLTLSHDTRDNAFLATQGHFIELAYEQAFGSFDYPRGELDYRQYFLMRERPDGSGRHTLAYSFRLGFSGTDTPIYENYFSGGYSTMRGFDFRGASPMGPGNVAVGGQFRFLGSVEYFFPLTADDMIKGVVFCDYGTTESEIELNSDNYRVAPGAGLRLNIPAMGPAPLALDFAIPVTRAPTDNVQNFSFFFGFSR